MRFLKIAGALILGALLLSAVAFMPSRLCFTEGESYTFFCGDSSKNCFEFTSANGAASRLVLSGVCGESTEYKEFDMDGFLKSVNGEIVFCEKLSDSVNYYCTADLPYFVELYGEKINLHICVKDDCVKVASPIIFGGY